MKRKVLLVVVVLLGCLLIFSSVSADEMNGCFVPDDCYATGICSIWPMFIDPPDGTIDMYIPVDHNIHIRGGWGTCTRGLAQSFSSRADLQFALDGDEYLSRKESRQLWTQPVSLPPFGGPMPCLNGYEDVWVTFWVLDLGVLDPGFYEAHFTHEIGQPIIDGTDFDGDGKPDKYDVDREVFFNIWVFDDIPDHCKPQPE